MKTFLSVLIFLFLVANSAYAIPNDSLIVPLGTNVTIDGNVQLSEWSDALLIDVPNIPGTIYVKHTDSNLLVAFVDINYYSGSAGIYIDTKGDGGASPQADDLWIHGSAAPFEWYGDGIDWVSATPNGWSYVSTQSNEFEISLSKMNVHHDSVNTLGVLFSFLDWSVGGYEKTWPTGGNSILSVPNSWATMIIEPFITGLNHEIQEIPKVKIFPNPCENLLTIDLQGEELVEIHVLNANGSQYMKQKLVNQQEVLDVSSYAPGIYFIRFIGESGILTKKLIIK